MLTWGSPGVLNVQILQASVRQKEGLQKIMRNTADGAAGSPCKTVSKWKGGVMWYIFRIFTIKKQKIHEKKDIVKNCYEKHGLNVPW